jgi:arginine deiminase
MFIYPVIIPSPTKYKTTTDKSIVRSNIIQNKYDLHGKLISVIPKLKRSYIKNSQSPQKMEITSFKFYKPITNMSWGRVQLCKIQKSVHSTRSRKWSSLPVAWPWSVVLSGYSNIIYIYELKKIRIQRPRDEHL